MVVVVVALFGLLATASPFIYGAVTNRQRRLEKREDWDRQDLVAARAEAAQTALVRQAEEASRLLRENNVIVAESAVDTAHHLQELGDGQKVIHGLVNSNLTAAMQATLLATEMMVEALRQTSGPDTDGVMASKIAAGEAQIHKLKNDLRDRFEQQTASDQAAARGQEQSVVDAVTDAVAEMVADNKPDDE